MMAPKAPYDGCDASSHGETRCDQADCRQNLLHSSRGGSPLQSRTTCRRKTRRRQIREQEVLPAVVGAGELRMTTWQNTTSWAGRSGAALADRYFVGLEKPLPQGRESTLAASRQGDLVPDGTASSQIQGRAPLPTLASSHLKAAWHCSHGYPRPNGVPTRVPPRAPRCPRHLEFEYAVHSAAPPCTPLRRSGNAVYRETGIEGSNPSRSGFPLIE
jgi:hypothetical protein